MLVYCLVFRVQLSGAVARHPFCARELQIPPDSKTTSNNDNKVILVVLVACGVGVGLLALLSAFLLIRNKYLGQRVKRLVDMVRTNNMCNRISPAPPAALFYIWSVKLAFLSFVQSSHRPSSKEQPFLAYSVAWISNVPSPPFS
jgi:hypothetical protein